MTDSFDPQPKINLEPCILKAEDVAKFVNTDFDLQKDIIDQACKKVAMLNEKTAEQALILKLNNRIAEQQDLINKHVKFIESLRDTLTRGGEEFKEQEQRIAEQQRVIDELKDLLSQMPCSLYLHFYDPSGEVCDCDECDRRKKLLGENNG